MQLPLQALTLTRDSRGRESAATSILGFATVREFHAFHESHYSPHPVADSLQTPDPGHHFVTCPETGQLLHAEGAEVHKAHAGYHAVHVHDPSICGMDDVCDAEHVSAVCAPADKNMR